MTTVSVIRRTYAIFAAVVLSLSTNYVASASPHSPYRGWDYLVGRLRDIGVKEQDINHIYKNPHMPRFTFVPFSVKPRESSSIYTNFNRTSFLLLGANFIRENKTLFDDIQKKLHIPPETIVAILVIESRIGENTGHELVAYRLSRLASVCAPDNLAHNYKLQRKKDLSITFEALKERGRYLETTFLPEIPALIEIGKRNNVPVLKVTGSSAGAFGLPQFLPSAFLRFGVDGDKNGHVSLYSPIDAAWSVANYLSGYGYRADLSLAERRSIIWRYNKSETYIDAVLALSAGIRKEVDSPSPQPTKLPNKPSALKQPAS